MPRQNYGLWIMDFRFTISTFIWNLDLRLFRAVDCSGQFQLIFQGSCWKWKVEASHHHLAIYITSLAIRRRRVGQLKEKKNEQKIKKYVRRSEVDMHHHKCILSSWLTPFRASSTTETMMVTVRPSSSNNSQFQFSLSVLTACIAIAIGHIHSYQRSTHCIIAID